MTELEQAGQGSRFLLGFEESCGYLTGMHVRDKDGVNAALLLCELCAWYKRCLLYTSHNSQVYVQTGQWVEQGQLLAAMGSTGNAYGNHCHFEIRVNGVKKDPANYIGRVYNR